MVVVVVVVVDVVVVLSPGLSPSLGFWAKHHENKMLARGPNLAPDLSLGWAYRRLTVGPPSFDLVASCGPRLLPKRRSLDAHQSCSAQTLLPC